MAAFLLTAIHYIFILFSTPVRLTEKNWIQVGLYILFSCIKNTVRSCGCVGFHTVALPSTEQKCVYMGKVWHVSATYLVTKSAIHR